MLLTTKALYLAFYLGVCVELRSSTCLDSGNATTSQGATTLEHKVPALLAGQIEKPPQAAAESYDGCFNPT